VKLTDTFRKVNPVSPINWDALLRQRFANADAEIAPDDKFTKEALKKAKKEKDE
jgi:hypothetical protein|tara:strand:- start:18 stop:179 length:162 start_codon:yes stop_codon:yes gene_type:complete